jgi:hypothetical protein
MQQEKRYGRGPAGFCICPKCGTKKPHKRGTPCQMERCPECGAKMVRENSYHHQLIKEKKQK